MFVNRSIISTWVWRHPCGDGEDKAMKESRPRGQKERDEQREGEREGRRVEVCVSVCARE